MNAWADSLFGEDLVDEELVLCVCVFFVLGFEGKQYSHMKSSSQFSSRSWLLDPAMFSSVKRSS